MTANEKLKIENEKLKKENEALKNRCRVLGEGVLCGFCPMECKHRTDEFLKEKSGMGVE